MFRRACVFTRTFVLLRAQPQAMMGVAPAAEAGAAAEEEAAPEKTEFDVVLKGCVHLASLRPAVCRAVRQCGAVNHADRGGGSSGAAGGAVA